MNFEEKVRQIEKEVMDYKYHQASTLSCLRTLVTLYYRFLKLNPHEDRDRFLLSKAHASSALYFILADLGFFDKSEISKFDTYATYGIPGIEFTGGSLGMGLGVACGMAYGLKMKKKLPLVVCMVGDGELYEGSTWESIQFASAYRLNNLICLVDRNWMSANDFTENFSPLEPLEDKFNAFGWDVVRINDNPTELLKNLCYVRFHMTPRPLCIIVNTVKGCGHKEFEGDPMCHTRKI